MVVNPQTGTTPAPHEGATITATLNRSLIHSPGGGLNVSGGVSRPDAAGRGGFGVRAGVSAADWRSGGACWWPGLLDKAGRR
jgi:hypothetical protein